jgi:hypothetical protein
MDAPGLLDICDRVYYSSQIVAGPSGRDGASIHELPDCRVLAFRGTLTEGRATFADWLNDFHADLISDDRFPGRVHAGFAASLTALWPGIIDLATQSGDDRPLYITGHSKGGALAFLAAHLLAALDPICITFAAPRVGDYRFSTDYACSKTWRYENRGDIVPRLPPLKYHPCGNQIVSPASFAPPEGIQPNHSLATGYKPWVM